MRRLALLAVLIGVFTALGVGVLPTFFGSFTRDPTTHEARRPAPSPTPAPSSGTTLPLAGVRVVVDPGHQLGNRNFPRQIDRLVDAGGFTKACNTTGTASPSGFPEATFTWRVARVVERRLEGLGARVILTRTGNSPNSWGPCVDERGSFGQRHGADLTLSLHADGAASSQHGFHVIVPPGRAPWTADIAVASLSLGRALKSGLIASGSIESTYIPGAIDERSDLGTLNRSDVPIAMVELGNMRNATDARLMESTHGQEQYAAGLITGIRRYLGR